VYILKLILTSQQSTIAFSIGMAVIRASFSIPKLCKPQNFAFALSKSFGITLSLIFLRPTWQTSKLAFAFSRAYIFHTHVSFSQRTLSHSTQLLLFQQQIYFPQIAPAGNK